MELLLALLIQHAAAPERMEPVLTPRLAYALRAGDAVPRRPSQGRRSSLDWDALDRSLTPDSRRERRGSAAPATPRETLWLGVPVRIIDGRVHGLW